MKIDTVRLVNYRRYSDLKINFHARFNVLAGINGSGKTTILNAICETFTGFTQFLQVKSPDILKDAALARLRPVPNGHQVRFEPQYPLKVQMWGKVFEQLAHWGVKKESPIAPAQLDEQVGGEGRKRNEFESLSSIFPAYLRRDFSRELMEGESQQTLPLLLFYRARRTWDQGQPDELHAAQERNSRFDAYSSWWDASLDASSLQSWVIGKCLERYQKSSESGIAFDAIDDDELALVNGALAAVLPGYKGLRYDMKQRTLFLEKNDAFEPASPFSNLSDGQKSVVGLLVDMARRLCLLNPHLGNAVIRDTPGVILIDELDMHLHPRWQRDLTRGLQQAFPSLQFIVSSHSPQVLGELRPEQIILLDVEGTAHPEASYGLDSSKILEEVMDAPMRAEPIEEKLTQLFAALARNELAVAREYIATLSALAPNLPEVGRAEAIISRKEIIGR